MYDALHNALHSLQASGAAGFEGLIVALIGRLTGRRFFLAKSSPQAGKDASTAGFGETYADIECKRYRRGASPTAREVMGGFDEAIAASRDGLDLWLVVSTGAIGSQMAEELKQKADRGAVAVDIIDWQEAGLPQLALPCAAFPEKTLDELREREVSSALTGVEEDLQAVRADLGFAGQLADLHQRLSAADLGLDHARAAAQRKPQAPSATTPRGRRRCRGMGSTRRASLGSGGSATSSRLLPPYVVDQPQAFVRGDGQVVATVRGVQDAVAQLKRLSGPPSPEPARWNARPLPSPPCRSSSMPMLTAFLCQREEVSQSSQVPGQTWRAGVTVATGWPP